MNVINLKQEEVQKKKWKARAFIIVLIVLISLSATGYLMVSAGVFFGGSSGLSAVNLDKGLIGHWSLAQDDLKSSTMMADKTPYGHDGTITAGGGGFTTDQKGQSNRAYDFDGSATNIAVGDINSARAISYWFNPDVADENALAFTTSSGIPSFTPYLNNGSLTFSYGSEIITNGGAETGSATGWLHYEDGGADGTLAVTSADKYSGTYSFREQIITTGSGRTNIQFHSGGAPFTVTAGQMYRLRFAIKGSVASTLATVVALKNTTPWTNYGFDQTINITTDWTYNTFYFISSQSYTTDARIDFFLGLLPPMYVWIDDVSLTTVSNTISANQWSQVVLNLDSSATLSTLKIGNYFNGRISDVRVYNRTLSPAEINQLYQSYNPSIAIPSTEKGLIGYWTLDRQDLKSATRIADVTPYGNDGTITGATFTTDRKGIANRAMSFNGTSNYIQGDVQLVSSYPFTMCAWVKANDVINPGVIVSFADKDVDNTVYGIRVYNNQIEITARNPTFYSAGSSASNNVWYHICGVYVGDTDKRLFVNANNTANLTDSVTYNTNIDRWNIGRYGDSTPGNYFNGSISDVRIYNRALSQEEITQLYQSYNPSIVIPSTEKGLIANYSLDQDSLKSSTIVADLTPYGNDGTITPGASAGFQPDQKGQANRAYDFDGADTVINTGSEWIGTQAITASAWIYVDGAGEGTAPPLGALILNNNKFIIRLDSSNQRIRFSSDLVTYAVPAVNSVQFGQWYHIAVTRTSANPSLANIYINGVLSGAANQSSGTPTAGTANVTIGNTVSQIRTFDGRISDLRVYNRVLSTAEIQQLYQSYR